VGSGRCYYQNGLATYTLNATVYAGANLIANGSPRNPCPYYNGTTFTDASGVLWRMQCGVDTSSPTTGSTVNSTSVLTMADCMAQCTGQCYSFMFSISDAAGEPADGSTATALLGTCYLRTTLFTTISNVGLYNYAVRAVPPAPASTTSASVATTSVPAPSVVSTSAIPVSNTASASGSANTGVCTTTGQVQPNTPVCPAAGGQSFVSPCGSNYTITCGSDTNPSSVSDAASTSLSDCMAQCDAYAGCRAAVFANGNRCYLKTQFTGLTNTGSAQSLVRLIPPNPAYAVPFPAGSVNASSGCGQALPAGLVADGASVQYNYTDSAGNARLYRIHIPKYYDPSKASPLIFGFPGNAATALEIESQTQFNDATVNPYGIAVYVQGRPRIPIKPKLQYR
jgi:hypothetical protein